MTEEEIKTLQDEKAKLEAENAKLKEEQEQQKKLDETIKEMKDAQEKHIAELEIKHKKETDELKDVIKQVVSGNKMPSEPQTIADKINAKRDYRRRF